MRSIVTSLEHLQAIQEVPLPRGWSVEREVQAVTVQRLHAICDGSPLNLAMLARHVRDATEHPAVSVPSSSPAPLAQVVESAIEPVQMMPLALGQAEAVPRKPRRRRADIPVRRSKVRSHVLQTITPAPVRAPPVTLRKPDRDEPPTPDALLRRVLRITHLPLAYIPNPVFEQATRETETERELLSEWVCDGEDDHKVRVPSGLPQYLASLYEIPLLSRENERHLFRKMNYLKFVAIAKRDALDASSPSIPLVETIERLYAEVEETRNDIVRANLRLVVSIAKRHAHSTDELFSLISDGNMSLMRAVEKFDFGRGFKFSTYASWAIMKNFARTIPQERKHQSREKSASSEDLFALVGSEEHDLELCDQTNRLRRRIAVMDRFLQVLDDREFEIIVLRFGLDGEEPKTLKQTGAILGVTKERIRQLQTRAMTKLRNAASEASIDFDTLFPEESE